MKWQDARVSSLYDAADPDPEREIRAGALALLLLVAFAAGMVVAVVGLAAFVAWWAR